MKKGIATLIISIIAGFVVWYFTQSRHSPFSDPDVTVGDLNISPERVVANEPFEVSYAVRNNREEIYIDCNALVSIWSVIEDWSEVEAGGGPACCICESQTPEFDLTEGLTGGMVSKCTVREPGDYEISYGADCHYIGGSSWQKKSKEYIRVHEN